MSWRFHAFTAVGDGRTRLAYPDLPLRTPSVLRELSGPGEIAGSISPEMEYLKTEDGNPVFQPFRTVLAAEYAGRIIQAGMLEPMEANGPNLELTAPGLLAGMLEGIPHTGNFSGIQVDPLDVVRDQIIGHVQGQPDGDLGVTVDGLKTKVRIGEEVREVEFETGDGEQVSFEAGPYVLSWFNTDDLLKELNDLSVETPFDYLLESSWSGDLELKHRLRLGHPKIGSRRAAARFAEGENITVTPAHDWSGEDYASEVLVLGSGEGRDMVRGSARASRGRFRRVRIVSDKSINSKKRADALAQEVLKQSIGESDLDQIEIMDHPNAALSSFDVGDEVYVQWRPGWKQRGGMWVRVLSMEFAPDADRVTLKVARVEKV